METYAPQSLTFHLETSPDTDHNGLPQRPFRFLGSAGIIGNVKGKIPHPGTFTTGLTIAGGPWGILVGH